MTHDREIEDLIRDALGARSERVQIERTSLDASPSRGPAGGRLRWLAAVAATVVAGVLLVSVLGEDDPADDDTPDLATRTTTTSESPTTTAAPGETTTTTMLDPAPDVPLEPDSGLPSTYGRVSFTDRGGDAWIADPMPSSLRLVLEGKRLSDGLEPAGAADVAAVRWIETMLGITDPTFVGSMGFNGPDEGVANTPDVPFGVYAVDEGGEVDRSRVALAIGTAQDPDGLWHVATVASPTLWISRVEWTPDGNLLVAGGGSAFEGTALLTIDRGEPTVVSVGALGPRSFAVEVPFESSDGLVEVMLQAGTAVEGEIPATAAFVTRPATSDLADPTFSVFGVAADDVLKVRSGPSASDDIVTTLAPDASGVRATGAVGGESATWIEVVTPEGVQGWVNRRFVVENRHVAVDSPAGQRMDDVAVGALCDLGAEPACGQFDAHWADRVEIGGVGVYADAPTPFTTVVDPLSTATLDFNPLPDFPCDECVMTTLDFLDVRAAEASAPRTVDIGIEPTFYGFGFDEAFLARFDTIVVRTPDSDPVFVNNDWRVYTFVFDWDGDQPVVRGVLRWGWTP